MSFRADAPKTLEEWAGSQHLSLTLLFTDIRVGINSGQVEIRENDIYGLTVNMTSRIQHSVPAEGIRMSSPVKEDYERVRGRSFGVIFRSEEIELASFGRSTLWQADSRELREAWLRQTGKKDATHFHITPSSAHAEKVAFFHCPSKDPVLEPRDEAQFGHGVETLEESAGASI